MPTVGEAELDVVQQIYAAMAARNLDTLARLIDDSCVITQDPDLPWGGRFEGFEGFATFGLTLTSTIESAGTTEALYLADDEVIQVGRTRGTVVETGTAFDIAEVHRWKIVDGKAVAAHFAIDTPGMLEALGDA